LLAVIAIIGLLAAIALPAISRMRAKADVGAVKAQLAHIETAVETYYAEWDTYPPIGNDWLGGAFFPSEDIGSDGEGPFELSGGQWIVNTDYPGPDPDGTEGNYRLDPNEDVGILLRDLAGDAGRGNGRLDGTYYDRLGMFTDPDRQAMIDILGERTYYHYYAGYVPQLTAKGMPDFRGYAAGHPAGLNDYKTNHPPYYNRWVIYSVGPDGSDHGLHNYYLTMQNGEDVGEDAFASDPTDDDNNRILFEPSSGENNGLDTNLRTSSDTIIETRWTYRFNAGDKESGLEPLGTPELDDADGKPVFNYDVRQERRGKVYATPDGTASDGVIMRFGP